MECPGSYWILSTSRSFISYFGLPNPEQEKSITLFTMRTFALAITVALSLFQVSFAAPAVKTRDCQTIPSTANAAVRDQVYRITKSRSVTAKVLLSTFEVSECTDSFVDSGLLINRP